MIKYNSYYDWEEYYKLSGTWPDTAKARAVMFSLLDPTQRHDFSKIGTFKFEAHQKTGYISYGQHYNLLYVDLYWCTLVGRGNYGSNLYYTPPEITMVSQLLTLRGNYPQFVHASRSSIKGFAGESYGPKRTPFHLMINDLQVKGHYHLDDHRVLLGEY